jgi:Cdc6-like AAA superfamily ATPase
LSDADYLLKDEQSKNKKIDHIDYNTSAYFIRVKDRVLLEIQSFKAVFWYSKDIPFSEIEEIVAMLKIAKKKKQHKRKFYMIASTPRSEYGFEFRKFNIKKVELNVSENYNDDFQNVHTTVHSFLKSNNKNGLVLLHGKYGTGKTTYIRSLMSEINKRFIFLPLDLMDAINAPNFLPFISKYKNSILILEDAENLLTPRGSSGTHNNSLVNLLNLGDGLLADALSLKIICTFNADLKQIDKAILRKGRLVARYEFKELETEKARAVAKRIGIHDQIAKPTTLAEIYNKDIDNFSENIETKKVGFNQ